MSNTHNQARVETKRIYLRDLSFESPHAAAVGTHEWQPDVNINLNHQSKNLEGDTFEVSLRCTVTCRNKKKTVYVLEVDQAGVFQLVGFDESHIKAVLSTFCPNMLFPYIREFVDNILQRGGLPPLMLAPVNFDALYAQSLKDQQEHSVEEDRGTITTH